MVLLWLKMSLINELFPLFTFQFLHVDHRYTVTSNVKCVKSLYLHQENADVLNPSSKHEKHQTAGDQMFVCKCV